VGFASAIFLEIVVPDVEVNIKALLAVVEFAIPIEDLNNPLPSMNDFKTPCDFHSCIFPVDVAFTKSTTSEGLASATFLVILIPVLGV